VANDARTVDYRALLLEERASLESQLAELGYGEVGRLNYDSNFADTSQVTAERGETEALARELSDALADVERALGKLQDGQYGRCERCGKEIAPARLEAMPAVKTCIACASAQR
jgi:RNA polymerase-binding transcription factor DksA